MNLWNRLRRLFEGGLPDGATGDLDADEHVVAVAALIGGTGTRPAEPAHNGHVVVTSLGLWLPDEDGPRRIGWHLISRASWGAGALTVVEAREDLVVAEGVVLLADLPERRLRLADPGRVPETVHTRVTGSIRSRHHRDLPDGGVWFVQRRVPGRDGTVLQVRPDPGTDRDAVARLAAEVARKLVP
jgi:hypothetical protein